MLKRLLPLLLATLPLAGLSLLCDQSPTESKSTTPPPSPYSLDSGEVVRILYPNGGDTLQYGDTVKVRWIANAELMDEMVVGFLRKNSGPISIALQENGEDWLQLDRDIPNGPYGSTITTVDAVKGIVLVEYPIVLVDTTHETFDVNMSGSAKFRVSNPYKETCEPCTDGDYSDAWFTINR